MNDIGAAVLLAQGRIRRFEIEQQHRLVPRGVRQGEKLRGVAVDQHHAYAVLGDLADYGAGIAILRQLIGLQLEGLVGEAARGVVVGDRQLGAADACVLGHDIQARNRDHPLLLGLDDGNRDARRGRCGLLRGLGCRRRRLNGKSSGENENGGAHAPYRPRVKQPKPLPCRLWIAWRWRC